MKRIYFLSLLFLIAGQVEAQKKIPEFKSGFITCSDFHITQPIREIFEKYPVDTNLIYENEESEDRENRKPQKFRFSPSDGPQYGNDPSSIQKTMGTVTGRAPIVNIAGQSVTGLRPMDPTGAAGPNHYVQMINSTTFQVFNKTGTSQLIGTLGDLWTPHTANAGDPVVLYDKPADRWFLAQFGSSADKKIYIAISTSSDPTGSYYTYTFTSPQFPDYLKFSTWVDGYYMTSNQSQKVFAFERTAMLAGNSGSRAVYTGFAPPQGSGFFVPLPGDASDGILPNAGAPCPIFSYSDNGWGAGYSDAVNIYQMAVNWVPSTPTATITLAGNIPTASFDATYDSNWDDVSQPGTTQKLDGIGGVCMFRAQWKSWSGYNTILLNWAVKISATQRSIKWCELRQNQGTNVWSMYQEGIYTPDALTRWMGSMAMDNNGSIAIAYMRGDGTSVFPGIAYTGRRSCDPLGTLPVTETVAIAGTGSQTGGVNRDGDYSHMTLDPDGITFWYTGEYMGGSTGGSAARTRVFSFQIPVCDNTAAVYISQTAGSNPQCTGASASFTATPVNGGSTPSYQWQVNGSNVGTNNPVYTTSSLTNGQVVTCIMTSNLPGVLGSPATSNAITMTVNAFVTPSVSIALTSGSNPSCSGSVITFTATPVNGGTSPSYQWKIDGVNAGTNSATFSTGAITNGQVVTCVMTSTALCATTPTATSNGITMTITASGNPTVSIAQTSGTNPLCGGSSVTFTATVLNNNSPTYQWKVDGVNVGTNSSTYTTSSLTNGQVVRCDVTATLTCPILVYDTLGTSTNLNATNSTVGDPYPTYYGNGRQQYLIKASELTALGLTAGNLNAIAFNVAGTIGNPLTLNGYSIKVGTTASNSTTTTFLTPTFTTVFGPSNYTPVLNTWNTHTFISPWSWNGTSNVVIDVCFSDGITGTVGYQVYQSTSAFVSTTYYQVDGNGAAALASCSRTTGTSTGSVRPNIVFTSSLSTVTVPSNAITMTVNPVVTPSVTIAITSGTNPQCAGSLITFTATPVNGGTPTYQWKLNGVNTGLNSPTFTSSSLTNGQIVSCVMTTSLPCPTQASDTSNTITMTVNPVVTPTVSILQTAGTNPMCTGSSATFTATVTNGSSPTYQWKVNSVNVGTNSSTYTTSSLTTGQVVSCAVTATLTCPLVINATLGTATGTNATTSDLGAAYPTYYGNERQQYLIRASEMTALGMVAGNINSIGFNVAGTIGNPATMNGYTIKMGDTTASVMTTTFFPTSMTTVFGPANYTPTLNGINTHTFSTPFIWDGTSNVVVDICFSNQVVGSAAYQTYQTASSFVSTAYYDADGSGGAGACSQATATATGSIRPNMVFNNSSTTAGSSSNNITMTVNPVVTPSVSIAITTGSNPQCAGASITFTATPTNGGTPAYQWKIDGVNAGTNSSTFTTSSLANGQVVSCTMTSTASCASPTTANSNNITMTVNPAVTPSVLIAITTGSNPQCIGASITFTATPTNGGTPSYQWKVNGVNAGTNSPTFTTSSLTNGQIVNCVMTSTATCASPTTATSNSITMTVNAVVTPSVSISITTGSNPQCAGASITFTATPTNGGTPSYQWKVNGVNAGTNSSTFTTSTLTNGQIVSCVMTSTATCASPTTATSNSITMTVNAVVTPSVSIAITTGSNPQCAGASITFTATPTNGGTPSYQWKVDGVNVGSNSTTYTTTSLTNGQIVSCVMTSTATCASPTTANSNSITMTVNPILTPLVSIAITTGSNPQCAGASTTFTATPTNGGTPFYQWKVNGSNVGTNSPTFTTSTLTNGQVVSCVMASTATCASPPTATSNSITMTVNAVVTPAVSIAITTGTNPQCAGASITFTATPTNGGTPSYQWKIDGANVATNSPTFGTTSLTNGQIVSCVMTSTATCASPTTATSNSITMIVNAVVTPSVSIAITTGTNPQCAGASITFTATPTNGGTPSYQWKIDGANIGTNSPTFTTTSLTNGQIVSCVMTSTATCASPTTATSNSITMTVNAVVTPSVSIAITTGTNPQCAGASITFTATPTNGGTPSYQWKIDGANVGTNSPTFATTSLTNGQIVSCVMTSTATCATPTTATSNSITMTVNAVVTPLVSIAITSGSNPQCAGASITFTATPTNGGTPSYQWKIDGANVGTNSPTFTTTSLTNGQIVSCVMTSTATCASPTTATSNSITMIVNAVVTPSVSIAITTGSNPQCAGASITFTATPINGGTPSYQWKVDGSNVGTNSSTFTTTSLTNGQIVSCIMTSTATCASPTTATLNSITMIVNAVVTPSVSIAITTGSNPQCAGASITFTATPINGGTPSYQWKIDGANVGTNSPTFTTTSLTNGQIVSCVMTSTATCASPTTATSNSITMTVNAVVTPSVSIAITTGSNPQCAGALTTFTATPTNGGTPSYQWKVNGVNSGSNIPTYTTTTLTNGQIVSCVMTSTATCASPITATSNLITINVNPLVNVDVSIVAAPGNNICPGTNVIFTATPVNGGSNPIYQWKKGLTNVGTNSPNYNSSSLNNGDVITCVLTSDTGCATNNPATSNPITINWLSNGPMSITSFTPSSGNSGDAVTITGSGFTGATAVYFNGIFAAFSVDNDNQISAVVPNGAVTGLISVQNLCETVYSLSNFTIQGSVTLNLQFFIEGFYTGNNTMNGVVSPTVCDTVEILLAESSSPYLFAFSATSTIDLSGNGNFTFPGDVNGNSYYIVIHHRNTLQTWSALPVAFNNTTVVYTFSDTITKAYGNNMRDLGDGNFAIFSGDINQDGNINSTDFLDVGNKAQLFSTGYLTDDLTGDWFIESADYSLVENNIGLFLQRP